MTEFHAQLRARALEAVNDQLYQSCTTCHMHYRRNYGRGATPGAGVR